VNDTSKNMNRGNGNLHRSLRHVKKKQLKNARLQADHFFFPFITTQGRAVHRELPEITGDSVSVSRKSLSCLQGGVNE